MPPPAIDTSFVSAASFTPRAMTSVTIAKHVVSLYPVVDATMPVHERAYAFQMNKAAIMNLPVKTSTKLDALGVQLNASTSVDGSKASWVHHFHGGWTDFATNLTILSYHNSAGAIINNATIAGAQGLILKPIQDGPVADCRPADIRFVRVRLALDYSSLLPAPAAGAAHPPCFLRSEFYFELPQTTDQVLDGNNNPRQLTTWHGAADLTTLTSDDVRALILAPCHHDTPILLQQSDFNLLTVKTDGTEIMDTITENVYKLAAPYILSALFQDLCPNYSDQPHAAIEHIRQVYQDNEGNTVTSTVDAYYQRFMNAARPFASNPTFPVSICNKFIDGLDHRLLPVFHRNFPQYHVIQPLDSHTQLSTMSAIHKAAAAAETDFNFTRQTAREAVIGQAFHMDVCSPCGDAYPSQAESTLSRYSANGRDKGSESAPTTPREIKCWGCDGPHLWAKKGKRDEEPTIVCPNADKPGVKERAKQRYDEYKQWVRTGRSPSGTPRGRRRGKRSKSDSDDSDADKVARQFFTKLMTTLMGTASTPTAESTPPNKVARHVFLMEVIVMALNQHSKPSLPVQIQQAMPHIELRLGCDHDQSDAPAIRCVIDTATALSTGNFHFWAAIAKRFPHCVAKIYVPEDYSPIILSGIVQRSAPDDIVTTDLTVAFEFHMPYVTRDGHPTSLIIATGPNVTVNSILGIPFLQATGMVIDLNDSVAAMTALDCPPFQLDFRRPQNTIPTPDFSQSTVRMCGLFRSIIDEIERLESHFAKVYTTTPPTPVARTVTFEAADSPALLADITRLAVHDNHDMMHDAPLGDGYGMM